MKTFTIIVAVLSFVATVVAGPSPQVPICTFDPAKGEYVCPQATTPPICKFDPIRGEYVCPPTMTAGSTMSTEIDAALFDATAAKCSEESLLKCTRERQGSVCKNGQWEVVHRCTSGQQCDMKDGKLCCRTRGPGFSC